METTGMALYRVILCAMAVADRVLAEELPPDWPIHLIHLSTRH